MRMLFGMSILSLLFATGCGANAFSKNKGLPKPQQRVDHIEAFSLPVAVNLDNIPGSDGVQLQLYLFQNENPKPVIAAGTLEIMMFDRRLDDAGVHTVQPFKVWEFSAKDAAPLIGQSMVGWNYRMELSWGNPPPRSKMITVVVCYKAEGLNPVYSSPMVITVNQKT